jgi:CHAT domain-containing protein
LNTGYEANTIQDTVRKAAGNNQVFLAQGFDANVETVLSSKMQDYRIWHLATHGVYDETMPEFSGLVFSLVGTDGGPRFGFLKAQDIARLNVRAELVVLSACDSAAGDIVSGEGIMGLSYAFLHAGAKQVVSTLWSIDDAKSKELMVVFYKELMRNGGNAAAALRQSQLTVMRQPHNSEPYYWAGFELTSRGESRISSDSNKDVP